MDDAQQAVRVAAIKAAVPIFALLQQFGVATIGPVTQQIRCPVHKDRTPSARVYADGQTVYCFTCAKCWDVIGLTMAVKGLPFPAALDWLDTHYRVPPASAGLTDVLRAQLRKKPTVSGIELAAMVEQRIVAAKDRLGWRKTAVAYLALDALRPGLDRSGAAAILEYVERHG